MTGLRNNRQRRRNKKVKADAAYLLRKLRAEMAEVAWTFGLENFDSLDEEISEMLERLQPPTGAAAKIILTDYT